MKIVLVLLAVVTAVMILGAVIVGPKIKTSFSGLKSESGIEVRTTIASPGTLVEAISAPGEIEPHTSVNISAEVSARITELNVEEGDPVTKGDIIARLDDKDLRAALLSSKARRDGEQFRLRSDRASLDGLDSRLEFARRELKRMESLFETGDVSRRDYDNALERVSDLEASVESTSHSISVVESSLAAAEADIERAQDGLDNTIIEAPMDGIVTMLNVEVGEVVTGSATNPGTVLLTIADLSRMVMMAQVAESDIAKVAKAQSATLFINAYPDEEFKGTVSHIALQRSGNPDGTGFFRVEIEITLRGKQILSGLVANVDIEIESHEGLVVPYQAIVAREIDSLPEEARNSHLVDRTRRNTNVIYRIVDGKAVCTPVRPGASDLTDRLVLEGLDEGAEIITGPYKVLESIEDGEAVRAEGATDDDEAEDGEEAEDSETGTDATEEDAAPDDAEPTDDAEPADA